MSVKVSDAKFQFARTFLSEYWADKKDFEIESKKTTFLNLLRRSWSATIFSPLSSLSSVIVVSSSLLILTFILIFDLNIKRLLNEVGGSEDALIYFKLSSDSATYKEVEEILVSEFQATDVKIVLKSEALKRFSNDLAEHSGILEGLEGNPLPDSLEFKLPSIVNNSEQRAIAADSLNRLKEKYPQIDEVVVGAPWAKTAQSLREGMHRLSFIVLALVFGVVAFMVSNVVKLMLYAHLEEIEIMQLVGAPRFKVVTPYLVSGALLGVVGALLALFVSYFLFRTFFQPMNSYLVFGLSYEMFRFIGFLEVLMVFGLGLLLGVGGGWFALRKWIN